MRHHQPRKPLDSSAFPGAMPGDGDSVGDDALRESSDAVLQRVLLRVDDLVAENAELRTELSRCYEQLSAVFEITDKMSQLDDPRRIEDDLFRRLADTLRAPLIVFCPPDVRPRLGYNSTRFPNADFDAAAIAQRLRSAVKITRERRQSQVAEVDVYMNGRAIRMRALLGPLARCERDAAVIVALRDADHSPFDAADLLASETILVYGGHILRNAQMMRRLQRSSLETVRSLANALDARDCYTRGHSERVGWLARLTGEALNLSGERLQQLEWAGILHDIGKIGVPEAVLNKPGKLTDAEFEQVKIHARLGFEVLRPVTSLGEVAEAVLYHHENHDGTGYPTGRAADGIPLFAQILRVADTFDALTSTRSYRDSVSIDTALEIIAEGAGTASDPHITHAFIGAVRRCLHERPGEFFEQFSHLSDAPDEDEWPANAAAE